MLLLERGFKKDIINTDNLEVVKALNDSNMKALGITILRRVQKLLKSEDLWRICYVVRDENSDVELLAKFGLS